MRASVIEETKSPKEEFSMSKAIPIFAILSLTCGVLLFVFIKSGLMSIEDSFSFANPFKLLVSSLIASIGLIVFGVVLTLITPTKFVDDTNKTYQNEPLFNIIIFMFLAVLFEEFLFRGIIQGYIFHTFNNYWAAIIGTTVLFTVYHFQYFKKPLMLFNLVVPAFVFCWIYFYSSNLLVPIATHFLMNVGMTLLFKYNLIKLKES
ncbi:CPBP family intramembrane metalloprotease [Mesobacillus subterraneus]|uniref:CPBP family intramembrane glutamic endopeptidase n=1 Tax=Mesobacillus subterraneus TaxID=285983 RepID=UPI00273E0BCA|nr:CPBP family intramembrane glutamic endopeptidase [Mesobacillus subterraneus]WLR54547.1 CPBP family intramembrane metalloprotease [Mesobacillus subterraneus]